MEILFNNFATANLTPLMLAACHFLTSRSLVLVLNLLVSVSSLKEIHFQPRIRIISCSLHGKHHLYTLGFTVVIVSEAPYQSAFKGSRCRIP